MSDDVRQSAVVPWILRKDLEVYAAGTSEPAWTIKDPARLLYFHVADAELALLRMLDGRTSVSVLLDRLADRFPNHQFSSGNLTVFLTTVIRSGLVICTDGGYGRQLAVHAADTRRTAWVQRSMNLLSHRFRGIDPTPLLTWLDQRIGWIYHPVVLRLAACFVVMMALLVVARWDQLLAELPELHELLAADSLTGLAVVIVLVKVLHETAHGLTCRHYGGECHELGVLLIGFLPLLYCDVTDSWTYQQRRQRIHVAFAGIAVELFVAAVCALLWMSSVPGAAHVLFLNIMLVCSLNTLLVNGNPLLKYDGYYVLADALKIPNLGPRSREAAVAWLDRVVLGLPAAAAGGLTRLQQCWMPFYGAASLLYRLVVLTTILLVMHTALKPWRLESIVVVVAAVTALSLGRHLLRMARQRMQLARSLEGGTARAALGTLGMAAVAWWFLFRPTAWWMEAPFSLTPGDCHPLYVSTAGQLRTAVAYGEKVTHGQPVARLVNPELQLVQSELEGDLQQKQAQQARLLSLRGDSPELAASLPAARKAVENAQQRLNNIRRRLQELNCAAPVNGLLYPPRDFHDVESVFPEVTSRKGLPLNPDSHQAWLEEQTLLGWVGTPDLFRAVVYVSQDQVELIPATADVWLEFRSQPGQPLAGIVTEISRRPEKTAPPELVRRGLLTVDAARNTMSDPHYAVHVQLTDPQARLPPLYSTGRAQIRGRPLSPATRCWRAIAHTFAFEL